VDDELVGCGVGFIDVAYFGEYRVVDGFVEVGVIEDEEWCVVV